MLFLSQPTFLSWIGYYDLIDQSDVFVILDDVKFEKQSWHHRNNFKSKTGLELFTVPTIENKSKLIKDIEIFNPERVQKKFRNFLITNYSKAKFFKRYFSIFIEKFNKNSSTKKLLLLNISLIKLTLELLQIEKKILFSSFLEVNKSKCEKIIEICKKCNDNIYLSSEGAKEYLLNDRNKFTHNQIEVLLHNYDHPVYSQLFGKFKPYSSILDLIMNEGDNSKNIIQSGRKKNLKLI
jgi:hypothetical protein